MRNCGFVCVFDERQRHRKLKVGQERLPGEHVMMPFANARSTVCGKRCDHVALDLGTPQL
jgi:hypothetical protein